MDQPALRGAGPRRLESNDARELVIIANIRELATICASVRKKPLGIRLASRGGAKILPYVARAEDEPA